MDWEDCYQDDFTPWDKGAPAPPLLEWIENHPTLLEGRLLAPGSGMGHDGAALAQSTSLVEIVGIDISPTAVERANEMNGSDRFQTQLADLFQLPASYHEAFDWVWEHTCFCAIDPEMRQAYVEAVYRVLKTGGQLLGVFYRDPYDEEHPPGEGPPHGVTLEEIEKRFVQSGKFEIIESYVPTTSYQGRENREQWIRMRKC